MHIRDTKHEFAFYYQPLSALVDTSRQQQILLQDQELVHRIRHIVRLQPGDTCVLFDGTVSVRIRVLELAGKGITATIIAVEPVAPLQPQVSVLLPVCKREALEVAVDALTQLGVQRIVLVYTVKSRQSLLPKELERLQRIALAACEQAKRFSLAQLVPPVMLQEAWLQDQIKDTLFVFADPAGMSVAQLYALMDQRVQQSYTLLVGPEGDLTTVEKAMVSKVAGVSVALTSTILRAELAVSLLAGLVCCRSSNRQ